MHYLFVLVYLTICVGMMLASEANLVHTRRYINMHAVRENDLLEVS